MGKTDSSREVDPNKVSTGLSLQQPVSTPGSRHTAGSPRAPRSPGGGASNARSPGGLRNPRPGATGGNALQHRRQRDATCSGVGVAPRQRSPEMLQNPVQ